MSRLLLVSLLLLVACDTAPASEGVEIVAYRGAPITRADAAVLNPPFSPAEWEASSVVGRPGSSVFLHVTTICGDECSRTVRFEFRERRSADSVPLPLPGPLPESVMGTVSVQTYTPESFESAEIPILRAEIQDWGPEVYSGVIYPAPRGTAPAAPYVFWAESTSTTIE